MSLLFEAPNATYSTSRYLVFQHADFSANWNLTFSKFQSLIFRSRDDKAPRNFYDVHEEIIEST